MQPSARALLAALLLAGIAAPAPTQITVQSVRPARNARAAPTTAQIAITFATALDPATVTPASVRVYGRWSGVARGALALADANRTIVLEPARPFFAGEMVTVMCSSAIATTGGARLLRGHTWSFWTEARRGTRAFTLAATLRIRRTGEGFIQTYGAYAGDLDRDGAPDLSLPNETSNDVRVLRNDGCGAFGAMTVHSLLAGGRPSTNEGQDLDGDGWIDLAVGNITAGMLSILKGDGAGSYLPPVHYRSGDGTRGLAVLDLEADGDVDVVTANRVSSNIAVHRNLGDGTFAAATFFDPGGTNETAIAAGDADGDGVADLWVGNYGSRDVMLLLGDGAGGFTRTATAAAQGQPWMIAIADMDGDGHLDAITCNSSGNTVSVVRGDGSGGLRPAANHAVGQFPLAIDVGDVDGDGAHDVVASNYSSANFTVLWNDGSGGLVAPLTLAASRAGSCALLVDHDRDGDQDVIGVDELDDLAFVFRQTEVWPPAVQAASCAASLRLDVHAGAAGYGARGPRLVAAGRTLFVGVSGEPAQPYGLLAGLALEPGLPTVFGTFNLALVPLVALPGGVTDAFGEASLPIPLPAGVPSGSRLAVQGGITAAGHPAGLALTNPEVAEVR